MKQLLLRVPDEIHRRLAARAARESRSVNSVATEILDAASDADVGDRRTRLRSLAAAQGILRSTAAPDVSSSSRRRTVNATRGLGRLADELIARERDLR